LKIFAQLSFTAVWGQKKGFNCCEFIKLLSIANIYVLDVWGKRILSCNNKIFFLCFFLFILFATQLFSTQVTSSNLRNQAPLFTELCLLQAIQVCQHESVPEVARCGSFSSLL